MSDLCEVKLPKIEGVESSLFTYPAEGISEYAKLFSGNIVPIFSSRNMPKPINGVLIGIKYSPEEMGLASFDLRTNIQLESSLAIEESIEDLVVAKPSEIPAYSDDESAACISIISSECTIDLSTTIITEEVCDFNLSKKDLAKYLGLSFGIAKRIIGNYSDNLPNPNNTISLGSFVVGADIIRI